ncbi:MAG: phosphotransferase enzyme family protein [Thermomicrobiales bacterium]
MTEDRSVADVMEDTELLTGGAVNEVVRIGGTVRRSTGPWTPTVHALLHHLDEAGFDEAPKVLGIDDDGREVLSFMEGETVGWIDWPAFMRDEDGLIQLGRTLRRYHDTVRSFVPPASAVWRNPIARELKDAELVRHGDFSPFNTVWQDGQLTGVIDWDFAQPGSALDDLAYLAWYAVPLSEEKRVRDYGFAGEVDRARRIRALCEAYGGYSPSEVVTGAIDVIQTERDQMAELARRDVEPWVSFVADGTLPGFDGEIAWIRAHRQELAGEGTDRF